MENPINNPTVFFQQTFTEPLLYVRGYCQTPTRGRVERKRRGSGSAVVEKDDCFPADREALQWRNTHRMLWEPRREGAEERMGQQGWLRTAWEIKLPCLLRQRPLVFPLLLCSSLQGPGPLYCLSSAAITYTSAPKLVPENGLSSHFLLLSETNAEAFCLLKTIQIFFE